MSNQFNSTCDLYDEHLEAARVVPGGLLHFGGQTHFSGLATTVLCFEDNSRIKELVATPGNGRVMVVDGRGSRRCALVGDVLAGQAEQNGWEGIIVYGCVRDAAELRKLGLGIMALGVTPRKSTRRGEGQIDIPIQLDGVACSPGDRVFADEDGVLLLDPASNPR